MKNISIIKISLFIICGLLLNALPIPGDAGLANQPIGPQTTALRTLDEVGLAGLVIGVREPDSIGGVHVLHATASGPSAGGGQYWNQDHPDVDGLAVAGEKFGDAVAWGDFNGDGFPDLAIGIPYDSENHGGEHGSVNVLYGTAKGLSATGSQYFDQEILDVGMLEMGDLFGFSLAAGDFNHDGNDDLAIGAPGEAIGSLYNAGVLDVLYGSDDGLTQVGVQVFNQGSPGVYGDVEQADLFGFSLAVGDFNGDDIDDLAVGVPYENIGSDGDAGAINMLYGSPTGLFGNDEYHHQDTFCEGCVAEQGDRFGFALAAGDFDGDNYDDLAIGVPYEYLGSTPNVGLVNILYGRNSGGLVDRDAMFNQDTLEIPGCISENMDLFGYSLAAGDLNGDGYSDLVIGSPGESHWQSSTRYSYGVFNVIYGSDSYTGLTITGAQRFDQDSSGVYGTKEAGDQFGYTLSVGDLNADSYDDLVVGVPYEDLETTRDVGLVQMFFGSISGLESSDQWMNQETTGLGRNEAYDKFGNSLAIWPFPFPYILANYVYLPLMVK